MNIAPSHSRLSNKDLSTLLNGVIEDSEIDRINGGLQIAGLTLDSRKLRDGDLFLAIPGQESDGRRFAEQAVNAGATAVLFESDGAPEACITLAAQRRAIGVPGLRQRLSLIAARFFDFPSQDMSVVGITGTNGKTTCAYLIAQALNKLGEPAAMMGTIGIGQPDALSESDLTTTDAVATQRTLDKLRDQGFLSVCMEVSSHGLAQDRVSAVEFKVALLTNLSQDHLDYHDTMSNYAAAKRKLFDFGSLGAIVVNRDDAFGRKILQENHNCSVISYGYGEADVVASDCRVGSGGIDLTVSWRDQKVGLNSSLLGEINVPNLLATVATLIALEFSLEDIARVVPLLQAPPGRMELFSGSAEQPTVVVDYSHTPDSLERALRSLRPSISGDLWVVFGCGGDRDKGKRSKMGEVAVDNADHVVITNDNPRSEEPRKIASDIIEGIKKSNHRNSYEVILDRRAAIRAAIKRAAKDDLVLVAGKGHENTQTIGGKKIPFSDRQIVDEILGGNQ